MRPFLIGLAGTAMLCIVQPPTPVQARSCPTQITLADEIKYSAAVFRGRVESLRVVPWRSGAQTVANFSVQQWWKGGPAKSVEVRSCGGNGVICSSGFKFELGVSYVVFAMGRPLETSNCNRTDTVERSAAILEWLE